jgi:hypothetical protein
MTTPPPLRELLEAEKKRLHYKWAKRMARSLVREPDEIELRSLGRVPWNMAFDACLALLLPVIEDMREGLAEVVRNSSDIVAKKHCSRILHDSALASLRARLEKREGGA